MDIDSVMTGAISAASAASEGAALKRFQNSASARYTDAELRKTAKSFEAVYLNTVLQTMFDGVDTGVPGTEPSHASKLWKSMMTEEYAKIMSEGAGVGLSETIYRQLLKSQEQNRDALAISSRFSLPKESRGFPSQSFPLNGDGNDER